MKVVIATKNEGKIREIIPYFTGLGIQWLTFKDFKDFPDVVEDGKTFEENAVLKASQIAKWTTFCALADDSGLEVDLLNKEPGVFSSRYSGPGATDAANRKKLLSAMAQAKSGQDRKARFVCHMVLWHPLTGLIAKSMGICEGRIGLQEKGAGGFGYDSLFLPQGFDKTMAELTEEEKNAISHRGKAIQEMVKTIKKNLTK